MITVPAAALPTYERLRAGVLGGEARPQGLTAVAYHGMVRGLALILAEPPSEPSSGRLSPPPPASMASAPDGLSLDREFLRLLANMILQSQSRVSHVY